LTEPVKFTLPSLTNVIRNDGALGEFLTKDVLGEATGLEFKAIQNASGHGIDAVAIDVNTKTIEEKGTDLFLLMGLANK
jgi:hypothetical protein